MKLRKVKPNTRAVRRTMAATTRAARMPGILQKEENKIIPEAKVCIGCGEETDQAHQCTPKCKLCGGHHITGDRECKNKFKTPYIVRRRQWERKKLSPVEGAKQEKAGKGIPPKKTAEHFPLLRAPRSRTPTRTASRSRSRSAGGKATWAQVAEPENKEMKTLREANRQQAKKIAEQEETIRRMAADMAAMKEMLQKMVNKNQTAEDEEPAENAEEPPAKRRSPGSRGLKNKRATLQQHIRNQKRKPDVIMIQETTSQDPKLSGYRTHAKSLEQNQRGICTFVRRGVNSLEHDSKGDPKLEKQAVEIIRGTSTHRTRAMGHQTISYKGRNLIQDATEADLQLITDPRQPTLMGRKSTDRDTTPDLVFTNEEETSWANTKEDLGSDHCIVEINVPLKGKTRSPKKFTYTNWGAFRKAAPTGNITDIETWTRDLLRVTTSASREIETTEETDGKMNSRLAHLIEAKQSICNRWRKQRLNRKLRKKIAELNRAIHEHCTKLSAQQWEDTRDTADRQMHNGATRRLLRHLLDETKTKGHLHNRLAGIMQTAVRELGEAETKKRLLDKYLPAGTGQVIPRVDQIRILGLIVDKEEETQKR
ncbi:hypothetical protein HPB47_022507 [Ixodes persulcatus]|uniref:Uncharacterized protein n=1 Tax=Ixodes persulcatus TaxID=34615 RepID=A0AC60Q9G9_IXOPE|nr:hypothetical protein HPB47_022507 [Ixodes persulcatus]